eukprot:GHVR01127850.1.p1 GENE.GHVR01127850.1~~GHVR01127850.1.p1  ORF type:complete len:260 (+),score=27.11 GHVR01127850.1:50-829(+)
MCGRTACTLHPRRIRRHFRSADRYINILKYRIRFNVGPQTYNPIVFESGSSETCSGSHRVICMAKWGLVPSFATDEQVKNMPYNTINARVEKVGTSPIYRRLVNSKRCVVVVDGFYEWLSRYTLGSGKVVKVPHFFKMKKETEIIPVEIFQPPHSKVYKEGVAKDHHRFNPNEATLPDTVQLEEQEGEWEDEYRAATDPPSISPSPVSLGVIQVKATSPGEKGKIIVLKDSCVLDSDEPLLLFAVVCLCVFQRRKVYTI